jgi:hypothetical protein
MADPTGARQRTINSFFDSPRFPIKALPAIAEEVVTPPPPPPPPPAAAGAPATPPPAAAAGPGAPKLTLYLPSSGSRTIHRFVEHGLNFRVTANRPVQDVDVRLFEVVGTFLRPMGSAFRLAPGPNGAKLSVESTSYSRSKLRSGGTRTFRVVARATGRDGAIGTTSATFRVQ